MTGERGLHGDASRLDVADLTDEDRVGILTQDRLEPIGEGHAGQLVDLDLVDRGKDVFDRVLDRHDVDLFAVDRGEGRVEGRGLARTGRPRADHHAVRRSNEPFVHRARFVRHAELLQRQQRARAVEEPQDALLAEHRRGRRHANIEIVSVDRQFDLPVLGAPPFDDVHVRHDLDAAHQRRRHRLRKRQHLVQRTIGAYAHAHPILLRLDVHVRAAIAHRLLEDEADHLDDRRVLVDCDLGRRRTGLAVPRLRTLGELLERSADLGLVQIGPFDRVRDVGGRRHEETHRSVEQRDQLRLQVRVECVGDGDVDPTADLAQR